MTGDRLYFEHIWGCIANIESYVQEGKEAFLASSLVQDAVIRNFEIIGEAVKRVSLAFRTSHPEIPWKQIASFRDVLIHNYFGVDLEQVWRVIVEEMPDLKQVISTEVNLK